ncbi:hypothetical protein [Jiangella anatolica]|uniref:hypothetical protein n=1 Tax=Jiangella anatolica TaxID=2670374 RepID=UPI0011B5A0DE|nr:hypothetical protein [Jiangella anatolica]
MTNVYSARGGVVHKATQSGLPACGALNRPGVPYIETDQPVTCRRCLKVDETPTLASPIGFAVIDPSRGVRIL